MEPRGPARELGSLEERGPARKGGPAEEWGPAERQPARRLVQRWYSAAWPLTMLATSAKVVPQPSTPGSGVPAAAPAGAPAAVTESRWHRVRALAMGRPLAFPAC
jgi:hypothetical protein